jgi:hypothetical protein
MRREDLRTVPSIEALFVVVVLLALLALLKVPYYINWQRELAWASYSITVPPLPHK